MWIHTYTIRHSTARHDIISVMMSLTECVKTWIGIHERIFRPVIDDTWRAESYRQWVDPIGIKNQISAPWLLLWCVLFLTLYILPYLFLNVIIQQDKAEYSWSNLELSSMTYCLLPMYSRSHGQYISFRLGIMAFQSRLFRVQTRLVIYSVTGICELQQKELKFLWANQFYIQIVSHKF
jgi:hypothetical protein